MTQRFYRFKALAAVLATLVLNGPASAGKHETPFTGTSSGFVTTTGFDPEQNIVYTRLEGQGEATHLGHFTVTADVRIYVATPTRNSDWNRILAAYGREIHVAGDLTHA